MHTLVKTAAAIHNLALGVAYGGTLYAKVALRPALIAEIKDEKERGRVMADAWSKYNRINVPATIAYALTWSIERKAISKLHVDRHTQKLVAFKDLMITGAFLTGLSNIVVGKMAAHDYPNGVPLTNEPTNDAKLEKYRRYFRVMVPANLVMVGVSLALGPAIAGAIIRSQRRNFLHRLLAK
jgi:uncharacterized membrane protein